MPPTILISIYRGDAFLTKSVYADYIIKYMFFQPLKNFAYNFMFIGGIMQENKRKGEKT